MKESTIIFLIGVSCISIGMCAWHDNELVTAYLTFLIGIIAIFGSAVKEREEVDREEE